MRQSSPETAQLPVLGRTTLQCRYPKSLIRLAQQAFTAGAMFNVADAEANDYQTKTRRTRSYGLTVDSSNGAWKSGTPKQSQRGWKLIIRENDCELPLRRSITNFNYSTLTNVIPIQPILQCSKHTTLIFSIRVI